MIPHDAGLPEHSGSLPHDGAGHGPVAGRIGTPSQSARPMPVPQAGPPALVAAPDLMSLLTALRHRWISAVLLGSTLATLAGVGMWHLLTPKQTAFAQIKVAYTEQHLFPKGQGPTVGDFKTYLQTTEGEIKSHRVIASALKRDEVRRLGLEARETNPVQAILDDLKIEFKENSELVTILYSHPEALAATTVVNAIKEAYMGDIVYAKRNERARKVTELEKVYGESVDALKTKKENLKKIAQTIDTVDPKLWQSHRMETLQALRDARQQQMAFGFKLIEARAALDTFDARVKAFDARGSTPPSTPATTPVVDNRPSFETAFEEALDKDSEIRQMTDQLARIQDTIDDYVHNRGFSSEYVTVSLLRTRASTVRSQLARRKEVVAGRVRRALAAAKPTTPTAPVPMPPASPFLEDPAIMRAQYKRQVESLSALDEQLQGEIKKLATQAARTPVLAAEYEQLADEIKRDEENIADIGRNLERERIEMRAASRITPFQDAELMKLDNKKQLLAAGVTPVVFFFATCMGLAMLEFRKRRVRSATEISRGLGIRVVGAVPRMPHLERRLVGQGGESDLEGTPVMESIDAIRTRLLHESSTRSTRVVMVTSAGPGEGKTTLASALATSLARAGRRTLLLDGDLRRPAVHELFEIAMQPGFSEVLLGEIEVAEAAQEAAQENLSILPAGQWDREVLLALSRDGLEGVFERLSEEFDFIVVDSHPVLSATDSLLIGRQADAVILSVLREVSQMPRVYAASQQLTAVGIRVLGAVVNGTSPEEVFATPAVMATVS